MENEKGLGKLMKGNREEDSDWEKERELVGGKTLERSKQMT